MKMRQLLTDAPWVRVRVRQLLTEAPWVRVKVRVRVRVRKVLNVCRGVTVWCE